MRQRPYLTLAIDADIQRVGLTPGAVDDRGRALRVEVVALGQAVQSAGLHATCFKGKPPQTEEMVISGSAWPQSYANRGR